ncbi:MAG: PrsW family intramembrane metalloprotease [Clostridia bacterium]|nr:PrsW family intramembrane metalloprotease [Clostridia bacterium]
MNTFFLTVAGIVPAVVLCTYVYKKDKVEKEPLGLLIQLLLAGIIACIPAAYIEGYIGDIIDGFFYPHVYDGIIDTTDYTYHAVTAFVGVALVEEGCKWFFLVRITKNNKDFNSLFDGMLYAIFVSLGFAGFENILYVVEYGWMTAIVRALLSVPGHMFDGVMMGYYYSRWKIFKEAALIEDKYIKRGFLEKRGASFPYERNMYLSLIVPILMHGAYDFCCFVNEAWATIALYALVIIMYAYCFKKIKETSRDDAPLEEYVINTLAKTYPELPERIEAEKEMLGMYQKRQFC